MSFTNRPLVIHFDIKDPSPQVKYGIDKILELKQSHSISFSETNPDLIIHTSLDSVNLKHEAYKIVVKDKLAKITGGEESAKSW
jgi:phosphotransferase system IIA component